MTQGSCRGDNHTPAVKFPEVFSVFEGLLPKVLSMSSALHRLPLEKPLYAIEDQISHLEAAPLGAQEQEELRRLKRELVDVQKNIFGSLDPWQTVEVARHPNRPKTSDYLSLVFDEFVELHGDKCFGDDPAMLTGFAKLEQHKVLVVGHQKGKTLTERQACHFGCACLLYTSPSPRDRQKSRMPSSA